MAIYLANIVIPNNLKFNDEEKTLMEMIKYGKFELVGATHRQLFIVVKLAHCLY